ncbi:MAG: glycosyltransferase family 39 protein [Rhodospirillaceae bacterium]|nr:glycosyltransferase family 39 protein [Rhodospirillaceae bacterium]
MLDYSRLRPWIWITVSILTLLFGLSLKPLLPIDETRYLAVAWEMWLRSDFLVPHLNGATYSHKPPLLFWIINFSWTIFGLNEWSPRIIAPIFGIGCIILTTIITKRLYPKTQAYLIAPFLIIGPSYWALYSTVTMFDLLVVFWTLLGINALIDSGKERIILGWGIFAISIGLGILSKGPVILIYLLPAAIFAPYWIKIDNPKRIMKWYIWLIISTLAGILIALLWAIPASIAGGKEYSNAIFWGQSAGRIVNSFAHKQPFWWYAAIIPLLLFPWIVWPTILKNLWHRICQIKNHSNIPHSSRLIMIMVTSTILILSAFSGKQPHYLLPIFPMLSIGVSALLISLRDKDLVNHRFDAVPTGLMALVIGLMVLLSQAIETSNKYTEWIIKINGYWGILLVLFGLLVIILPPKIMQNRILITALSNNFIIILVLFTLKPILTYGYDMKPVAEFISNSQSEGYTVAYYGKYHGQFHFLGRLKKPIIETGDGGIKDFLEKYPRSKIISVIKTPGTINPTPDFIHKFRSSYFAIWDGLKIIQNPTAPQRR